MTTNTVNIGCRFEMNFPENAINSDEIIQARSIWYEKDEEIPGKLPPTTHFTYCIELLPDGTEFNKPVTVRHKNTRGFSANLKIPVGFYDRNKAIWINETMATVDPTGEWVEFQVTHFTPYDINLPLNLPPISIPTSTPSVLSPSVFVEPFQIPSNSYEIPSMIQTPMFHPKIPANSSYLSSSSSINFTTGSVSLRHNLAQPDSSKIFLKYNSDSVNHSRIFQVKTDNSITSATNEIISISNKVSINGNIKEKYYKTSENEHISRILVDLNTRRNNEIIPPKTGSYLCSLDHITKVKVQYYTADYFGGPPVVPTGVFEDYPIVQRMRSKIPVLDKTNSSIGSGWSIEGQEKIHRNVGNNLLIESNGVPLIFTPVNFFKNYNNFICYKILSTLYIIYFDQSGLEINKEEILIPHNSGAMIIDYNNDSLDDIMVFSSSEIQLYINYQNYKKTDEDPNFLKVNLNTNNEIICGRSFVSDYNGDGKKDVLLSNLSGVYVLQNTSPLSHRNPSSQIYSGEFKQLLSQNYSIIAEGDFNYDNKIDYIGLINEEYHPLYNNDNNFLTIGTETIGGSDYIRTIYVADVNKDGRDDLIVNYKCHSTIIQNRFYEWQSYMLNLEISDPDNPNYYPDWRNIDIELWLQLYIADLNITYQSIRLFITDLNGVIPLIGTTIYENEGFQVDNNYELKTGDCVIGDFNNDEKVDIIVMDYNKNEMIFMEGNNFGKFDNHYAGYIGYIVNHISSYRTKINVSDIDCDGNLDLLCQLSKPLLIHTLFYLQIY